jgi:hypothetical protein
MQEDIPMLRKAIETAGDVKLVIIDTVNNHMGKGDGNKTADVRPITTELTKIARDYSLCIIGITHLRKGEGTALQRVMGSTDWTGAARAVWVVDKEADGVRRRMLPAKVSHAEDQTGYAYTLQGVTLDGIDTAKIVWEDSAFAGTAEQALAETSEGGDALNEATDFLRELLKNGRVEATLANRLANERSEDFKRSTLKRAKARLGIVGVTEDNITWYWAYKKAA